MENAVGNNAKLNSRRHRLSSAPNLHSNEPRHWVGSWNMRCGENQAGLKRLFRKVKVWDIIGSGCASWSTFRSFEVWIMKQTFMNSCLVLQIGKLFCDTKLNWIPSHCLHEQPQNLIMPVNLQSSSLESCPTDTSSSGPSTIFAKSSSINWRTFSRWLRDTKAARLWSSVGSKCKVMLLPRKRVPTRAMTVNDVIFRWKLPTFADLPLFCTPDSKLS